jgi:hypothetical protein
MKLSFSDKIYSSKKQIGKNVLITPERISCQAIPEPKYLERIQDQLRDSELFYLQL